MTFHTSYSSRNAFILATMFRDYGNIFVCETSFRIEHFHGKSPIPIQQQIFQDSFRKQLTFITKTHQCCSKDSWLNIVTKKV